MRRKNTFVCKLSVLAFSFLFLMLGNQISAQNHSSLTPPKSQSNSKADKMELQSNYLYSFDTSQFEYKVFPLYSVERGYGALSVYNSQFHQAIAFDAPEGTYVVELEIEAGDEDTRFTLWSEDRRLMALPQEIRAGQKIKYSFFVNVRDRKIVNAEQDNSNSPEVRIRGEELISRNWDDQLTIDIVGEGVRLTKIKIAKANAPKILLAGDSTVTDQPIGDYASWGQILPAFVKNYAIANHARSGETLKSFIFSLRWDKLLSSINKGDIVLIQFGHNDQKVQWPRTYAAFDGAYPEYLRAFIADIRQRGGQAVLISPVARRRFDASGKIINTHKDYDEAVRIVAQTMGVPFIDLTQKTANFYESLGPVNSRLAFGNNGNDGTHHNYYGAYVIAEIVARALANEFPNIETLPEIRRTNGYPSYDQTKIDDVLWPVILVKSPEQTNEIKLIPKR